MKISDYSKVQDLKKDNIFLLDGPDGTNTILADDLAKKLPTLVTSGGNENDFGYVKLSDSASNDSDATTGIAATPKAVKEAYDLAQKALAAAGAAQEYTEDALKALFGGELPDPVLENNSPEVIQRAAYLGLGGHFWSVGDAIPIELNGTVGTLTFEEETYYAYIIGFNHNAALEGGNGIDFQFGRKTSTGRNLAFVDENYNTQGSSVGFRMNKTATSVGGWASSYMRNTICPAFFDALPEQWKKVIVPAIKYTDNVGPKDGANTNDPSSISATKDNIFLLAEFEVQGKASHSNRSEPDYQKQYDYYRNGNSIMHYKSNATTSYSTWWLRSVYAEVNSSYKSHFSVGWSSTSSPITFTYANMSEGFVPCFRVSYKGEEAA